MKAFKHSLFSLFALVVLSPTAMAASSDSTPALDGRAKVYDPLVSKVEAPKGKVAGFVIAARGSLTATSNSGETRALTRRSKFYSNETLKTGDGSRAQLRFKDRALMTLKPNSELNIGEYHFGGAKDPENKSFLELVSGGFRTISGVIGKTNKSAYRIQTPAASIGIRGTDYEVIISLDGKVFAAVHDGGISLVNDIGELDLGSGSNYLFAEVGAGQSPLGLDEMPEVFKVQGGEKVALSEAEKKKVAQKLKEGRDRLADMIANRPKSEKDGSIFQRERLRRDLENDKDIDLRISPKMKNALDNGDFTVVASANPANGALVGTSADNSDEAPQTITRTFRSESGQLVAFEQLAEDESGDPMYTNNPNVKWGYWNKGKRITLEGPESIEGGHYWMAAKLYDVAAVAERTGTINFYDVSVTGGTNVDGVGISDSASGNLDLNFSTGKVAGQFTIQLEENNIANGEFIEFGVNGDMLNGNGEYNHNFSSGVKVNGTSVPLPHEVSGAIVAGSLPDDDPSGFAGHFEASLPLDQLDLGVSVDGIDDPALHGFYSFGGVVGQRAPSAPFL